MKELTVDVETNSILAGAVKWTDESKEKAKKYSGIENIDFYISDGVIEGTYEESENKLPKGCTAGTNNFQNMDTELKTLIRLIVQAVLIV